MRGADKGASIKQPDNKKKAGARAGFFLLRVPA